MDLSTGSLVRSEGGYLRNQSDASADLVDLGVQNVVNDAFRAILDVHRWRRYAARDRIFNELPAGRRERRDGSSWKAGHRDGRLEGQ